MNDLHLLREAVAQGNAEAATTAVERLLTGGTEAAPILREALLPAMETVGDRFSAGECFLPEMLVAAHVVQACVSLLEPHLAADPPPPVGTVVLGTVAGDIHDIGKGIVSITLRGSGFEVIDLGVDVAPERFVEALRETEAPILALSALLSTTVPAMRDVVDALTSVGLRERTIVLVGGAPVTAEHARELGADGYAPDAATAARLARRLMIGRAVVAS